MCSVRSELDILCAELHEELARHGVELRALMPLAQIFPPPCEFIWLGTCRPPTALRLLETLRAAPPPAPRDLRAAVHEANARSVRDLAIKSGGGLHG